MFSGSYTDLTNKPTLFSGSYTDFTDKPTIPAAQVSSDWNTVSGITSISNKPTLFSGSYTDLTNKPTIPAAQVSSDWNTVSGITSITNKPTIPAAQVQRNWTTTTGLGTILNKPTLFSGCYTDLTNKPTIPAAQVSNDWNAVSGITSISNKPTITAAQVSSDWNAVSGVASILNKPAIITMTDINNTSNYTTRINTELTDVISGKQATINSTVGQLIIGNGNGATTTNTGLTWTTATNLLSTTNLSVTGAITGNITTNGNIIFGKGAQPQLAVNTSSSYSWGIMGNNLLGRTIVDGGYSTSAFPPNPPDNTIYRGAIFTYVAGGYSLTIPAGGIITGILMVGGGGGSSSSGTGGGGGGAVLYGQNIFIPAGVYTLYVANITAGQGGVVPGATTGQSTTGFGATILGGGSVRSVLSYNGGSGAGGTCVITTSAPTVIFNGIVGTSTKGVLLDSATLYNGSNGGIGVLKAGANTAFQSGGGGGAGTVGGNGNISGTITGNGGSGVLVNITGTNFYWGGGGGAAGCLTTAPNGGIGGGGAGTRRDNPLNGGTTIYGTGGGSVYTAPVLHNGGLGTGGGAGGVHASELYNVAGAGGSGIIILKYRNPPPCSSLVNIKRNTTST